MAISTAGTIPITSINPVVCVFDTPDSTPLMDESFSASVIRPKLVSLSKEDIWFVMPVTPKIK